MLCLSDLLQQALRRYGEAPALVTPNGNFTYRELDDASWRLASFMAGHGIGAGDRIALHLRNGHEYVIADLAVLKLAAVKVPLSQIMSPSELAYCVEHSETAVLISHASLPRLADGDAHLSLRIAVPDQAPVPEGWICWEQALFEGEQTFVPPRPRPEDLAMIAYTGGTTGFPKGVCHSQHRLAVNLLASIISGDIRADEVMLLATPLPHSAGYFLQSCLVQGGKVVLVAKFEPAAFLTAAREQAVTWTFAVPTMLYRLFDALAVGERALEDLRTIVYGAAPMSRERLEQGLVLLGPVFLQLYGQTECPNFITTLAKADHLQAGLLASCGRAVPMLDLRIVKADGEVAQAGEVGEVEVASPYLLLEYHKNPAATAQALEDRWLRTGDLGYLNDSRYLFLVDRAKDMIISGGMNVYSVEVEAALRQHRAVLDAAVIGVPDLDWGESVTAFVTMLEPVDEEELRCFAKTILSAYKVPKRFVQIGEMPLTKFGKIDKKALRCFISLDGSVKGMAGAGAGC